METNQLIDTAKRIAIKLQEFSCKKIDILDISKKTNQAKIMIISSVLNEQKAKVIANDILLFIKEQNLEIINIDGAFKGEWIVLDCKEIIIHIFTETTRVKYNLEKLWKDSKNLIKWQ